MRAVIQRVTQAQVSVDGQVVGQIGTGLTVLLGVECEDGENDIVYMVQKIPQLRIFADEEGRMNRSLQDIHGQLLIVSQFTLLGDARKGRRPGFIRAEQPERANELYLEVCKRIEEAGVTVETGRFMTHMQVQLVNDGPVTMLLDSRRLF